MFAEVPILQLALNIYSAANNVSRIAKFLSRFIYVTIVLRIWGIRMLKHAAERLECNPIEGQFGRNKSFNNEVCI
jgi:hypothetical protein